MLVSVSFTNVSKREKGRERGRGTIATNSSTFFLPLSSRLKVFFLPSLRGNPVRASFLPSSLSLSSGKGSTVKKRFSRWSSPCFMQPCAHAFPRSLARSVALRSARQLARLDRPPARPRTHLALAPLSLPHAVFSRRTRSTQLSTPRLTEEGRKPLWTV